MARKISGRVSQVLDYGLKDLQALSDKELRQAVSRVNQTANARLRYLESKNATGRSYVYGNLKEARGDAPRFSTRGKDREALINELQASKKFLSSKTSTITGIKNVEKQVKERISKRMEDSYDWKEDEDFELTDRQWDKFWKIYREAENNDSLKSYGSENLQDMVMNEWYKDKRRGKDYIIKKLLEREEEEYLLKSMKEAKKEAESSSWANATTDPLTWT